MNTKALIYYAIGLLCLIVAIIIFLNTINWWALVILVFGIAAVLLIRQGVVEGKKK